AALDPAAATAILPSNGRRIVRALEVIEVAGRPFAAVLPEYESRYAVVQLGLRVDRGELDRRIAERTARMWRGGARGEAGRAGRGGGRGGRGGGGGGGGGAGPPAVPWATRRCSASWRGSTTRKRPARRPSWRPGGSPAGRRHGSAATPGSSGSPPTRGTPMPCSPRRSPRAARPGEATPGPPPPPHPLSRR